tara:strand:+ start:423 stop:1064 length:642 start_codon:yes stop_codon:yes gene_type:complete
MENFIFLMYLKKENISNLKRIDRLKLINSICGIRGVHLIGTVSKESIMNLAIFSSVTHLGSNPSLLGFISRPSDQVKRDTLNNILSTGYYTINSIHEDMIDRAHQTSGKFPSSISEFDECGFHPQNIDNFLAPFVKSSSVQIGMKFIDSIPIKYNNTCLVIGEIELIHCKDESLQDNFKDGVGVVGLNSYYTSSKVKDLEYFRVNKNDTSTKN